LCKCIEKSAIFLAISWHHIFQKDGPNKEVLLCTTIIQRTKSNSNHKIHVHKHLLVAKKTKTKTKQKEKQKQAFVTHCVVN